MVATRSAQQAIDQFVDAIVLQYVQSKNSEGDAVDEDAESFVSAIEQDLKSTLRDRLAEIQTNHDDPLAKTVELAMNGESTPQRVLPETLDPGGSQEVEFSHGDALTLDGDFSHDAVNLPTLEGAVTDESSDRSKRPSGSADGAAIGTSPVSAKTKITARHGKRFTAKSALENADLPAGYAVIDVLGRGGMGIVYKARHLPLNRVVAVKKILTGADATDDQISRFQREAEAAAHLSHPNIVSVYEVGQHNGMPFFSLEFVEGQALSDLMRETTLSGKDAADLLIPISRAIHYSHGKGVLHRDLKPQNILLNENGVPKVADFGLAKRLDDDDDQDKTRAGLILGTPGYMAPEQAKSNEPIGPPTDVYALGCILYYMMTGRPPFNAPTPFETVRQVLHNEPVPPSKLQEGLDPDLETICLKALEKDVDRRYATADELADELQRYRNGEPILARAITPAERIWKWCKRNPIVATLTGLAASLAIVVMVGGPTLAAVIYGQKQEVVKEKVRADQNAADASKNAVLADKNAAQAEKNRQKAFAARTVAEKNAVAAAVQEKNAIDALKSMTFVVQQKMTGKSDLIGLREELLKTVRNGLLRMEKNENTARAQDMISAGIFTRLGDINMELGRVAKAREEYGKCVAVLEKLEQDDEEAIPYRLVNWSRVHQSLGDACRAAGDYPESLVHYKTSLEFRQQQVKESPSVKSKTAVAVSLGKLGSLSQVKGDLAAARDYMQQAVALREQLLELQPTSGNATVELLGAKMVLAKVLFQQPDQDQAMALILESTEGMKEFAERYPSAGSLHDHAMFCGELGVMQIYRGDADQADDQFQFAADTLAKLNQDDPNDRRIHQELEEALYGLSVAKKMQGNAEEAQSIMEKVVQMRRQSAAWDESNSATKLRLLLALARAGELSEGVKLADELNESLKEDATTRYELACGYAQLAEGVDSGDHSDLPTKKKLSEKAISNLEKALDSGFSKAADLQQDPDLSPLRESPLFAELFAELFAR